MERKVRIGAFSVVCLFFFFAAIPQNCSAQNQQDIAPFIYGVISDLGNISAKYEYGRWFGTEGEKEAADYLAAKMEEIGLQNVVQEPVVGAAAQPIEYSLTITAGSGSYDVDCYPLLGSPIQYSDITADVVWITDYANATSDETQGKIHLLKFGPPNYDYDAEVAKATDSGASAFILMHYKPDVKFMSGHTANIPGVSITGEDGIGIIRAIAGGGASARLVEQHIEQPIVSQNVVGEIPGKNPLSFVVIGGHYDSWWCRGCSDNAAGIAATMGVAKFFIDNSITPECTIKVIGFAGEEMGLMGSINYNVLHLIEPTEIMINLDMIFHDTAGSTLNMYSTNDAVLQLVDDINACIDYTGKTGYKFELVVGTSCDDVPFSLRCPTIAFDKFPYDYWHADGGQNHELGDTMDKIDFNDLEWTTCLALQIANNYCAPDLAMRDVGISNARVEDGLLKATISSCGWHDEMLYVAVWSGPEIIHAAQINVSKNSGVEFSYEIGNAKKGDLKIQVYAPYDFNPENDAILIEKESGAGFSGIPGFELMALAAGLSAALLCRNRRR